VQKRWLCNACEREWVFATNWSEGEPCPACRSLAVSLHQYQPEFPGLDIPRTPAVYQQAQPSAKVIPFENGTILAGAECPR
jgi:hypothetical protein